MTEPIPMELKAITEHDKREIKLFAFEQQIFRAFHDFKYVDRQSYLLYDKPLDPGAYDKGHRLSFFTEPEDERTEQSAELFFIMRTDGFSVNYNNVKGNEEPNRISMTPNNSFAGPYDVPKGRNYRDDELPYAIEKLKIHMNGIQVDDSQFLQQPADIPNDEGDFLTFEEIMKEKAMPSRKRPKNNRVAPRKERYYGTW